MRKTFSQKGPLYYYIFISLVTYQLIFKLQHKVYCFYFCMFLDPEKEVLDSKKIPNWYILKKYSNLFVSTSETSGKEGQDGKEDRTYNSNTAGQCRGKFYKNLKTTKEITFNISQNNCKQNLRKLLSEVALCQEGKRNSSSMQ